MASAQAMVAEHLSRVFGTGNIRVTNVDVTGMYSAKTLDVTFTTDPDPDAPPSPAIDDDHPF